MKKINQIYALLIILFLAVVLFLYYTHQVKFLEGLDGEGEEDGMGDDVKEEDGMGDDEIGDAASGIGLNANSYTPNIKLRKEGSRGGGILSKTNGEITGEYVPMSSKNQHSITTVLQDLETDFDKAMPEINKNDKLLSQRINALQNRVADVERSASSEDSNSVKSANSEKRITPSQEIKKV